MTFILLYESGVIEFVPYVIRLKWVSTVYGCNLNRKVGC